MANNDGNLIGLAARAWLLIRAGLGMIAAALTPVARFLGLMLRRLLEVLLALIVLFEEWGWRPLVDLIGRLTRFRLWAMLETWIASLPSYGALLVFVLPSALLFPLKLLALWLIAQGKVMAAGALFLTAKVVGTAFVARIFMLTRPALLRIGWFKRAYDRFVPWQEAVFAKIRSSWAWRYGRMVKTRVKHEAKQAMARIRALLGMRGAP